MRNFLDRAVKFKENLCQSGRLTVLPPKYVVVQGEWLCTIQEVVDLESRVRRLC